MHGTRVARQSGGEPSGRRWPPRRHTRRRDYWLGWLGQGPLPPDGAGYHLCFCRLLPGGSVADLLLICGGTLNGLYADRVDSLTNRGREEPSVSAEPALTSILKETIHIRKKCIFN